MRKINRIRDHRNRTESGLVESVLAVRKADLCYRISLLSKTEFENLGLIDLANEIEENQSEDANVF